MNKDELYNILKDIISNNRTFTNSELDKLIHSGRDDMIIINFVISDRYDLLELYLEKTDIDINKLLYEYRNQLFMYVAHYMSKDNLEKFIDRFQPFFYNVNSNGYTIIDILNNETPYVSYSMIYNMDNIVKFDNKSKKALFEKLIMLYEKYDLNKNLISRNGEMIGNITIKMSNIDYYNKYKNYILPSNNDIDYIIENNNVEIFEDYIDRFDIKLDKSIYKKVLDNKKDKILDFLLKNDNNFLNHISQDKTFIVKSLYNLDMFNKIKNYVDITDISEYLNNENIIDLISDSIIDNDIDRFEFITDSLKNSIDKNILNKVSNMIFRSTLYYNEQPFNEDIIDRFIEKFNIDDFIEYVKDGYEYNAYREESSIKHILEKLTYHYNPEMEKKTRYLLEKYLDSNEFKSYSNLTSKNIISLFSYRTVFPDIVEKFKNHINRDQLVKLSYYNDNYKTLVMYNINQCKSYDDIFDILMNDMNISLLEINSQNDTNILCDFNNDLYWPKIKPYISKNIFVTSDNKDFCKYTINRFHGSIIDMTKSEYGNKVKNVVERYCEILSYMPLSEDNLKNIINNLASVTLYKKHEFYKIVDKLQEIGVDIIDFLDNHDIYTKDIFIKRYKKYLKPIDYNCVIDNIKNGIDKNILSDISDKERFELLKFYKQINDNYIILPIINISDNIEINRNFRDLLQIKKFENIMEKDKNLERSI